MKGNAGVIATLQAAAAAEAGWNLQSRMDTLTLKFMGLKKQAAKIDAFGDDAHFFLKSVVRRILFLEGTPSYTVGQTIAEQSTVTALVKNQIAMNLAIVTPYEQGVQQAMKAFDDTTRNLYEHLLKWHEKDLAWLERELRVIQGLGENDYIVASLAK